MPNLRWRLVGQGDSVEKLRLGYSTGGNAGGPCHSRQAYDGLKFLQDELPLGVNDTRVIPEQYDCLKQHSFVDDKVVRAEVENGTNPSPPPTWSGSWETPGQLSTEMRCVSAILSPSLSSSRQGDTVDVRGSTMNWGVTNHQHLLVYSKYIQKVQTLLFQQMTGWAGVKGMEIYRSETVGKWYTIMGYNKQENNQHGTVQRCWCLCQF